MLKELRLQGVGPVADLDACFAKRLNVLTGDNGLGKSFLLDVAWWALTGTWAGGKKAMPNRGYKKPRITYQVSGKGKTPEPKTVPFDAASQSWIRPVGRATIPGLVIYGRADGSFSVWDPARNYWRDVETGEVEALDRPRSYDFSPETLWTGLREESGRSLCNGLIKDWVYWQNQPKSAVEEKPFELLASVIKELSHPSEPMEPGEPMRVFIDDATIYPTVRMPYGIVPLVQAAAGVRRVLSLAYLVVWAWDEHTQAARLRDQDPTDRLVLLLDEVESHLHPKWQRTILPSFLTVVKKLDDRMRVQVLCTSHSPLILASLEPVFEKANDRLFWFDIPESEHKVYFREYPWAIQGDVVGWLTSEIFGLKQARSKEAEVAIESAEAFMRGDLTALPDGLKTEHEIHAALRKYLPGMDPFWPRWLVETKNDAIPSAARATKVR
jgi:hypothetical protein